MLRIPLTATIWNLSSIRMLCIPSILTAPQGPNRDELMKDSVLDVLAELLVVPGELQGEAAGALRNLTLDGNCASLDSSLTLHSRYPFR